MQIRNLARFVVFATATLATIAIPTSAQDVDRRSALEVRTLANINTPAVKAMAAKRGEESAAIAVDNGHTAALQSMSRRDATLEKRFGTLALAGVGMGVKAVGGIFKGIKSMIKKKKAKKAAKKAAAAAAAASASGGSAASEKRDVFRDEDAPITILDPRDFDFTGLTEGIAKGVKALGSIVKVFKDMKKKKKESGDTAPVDDTSAAPAAAQAATGRAATGKTATGKTATGKAAAAAEDSSAAPAAAKAAAASQKRDVVYDEDAPVTTLDPRDFDFTGLTDGIAKGVKALGSIVKVFKDMKKKKEGDDTAPVDDSSAAPAAAQAATGRAATGKAAEESASLSSATDASGLRKRKTIAKRPVIWVA